MDVMVDIVRQAMAGLRLPRLLETVLSNMLSSEVSDRITYAHVYRPVFSACT